MKIWNTLKQTSLHFFDFVWAPFLSLRRQFLSFGQIVFRNSVFRSSACRNIAAAVIIVTRVWIFLDCYKKYVVLCMYLCRWILFKNWSILGLFFFIFVISTQFLIQWIVINIVVDWIRTTDLWYWKRPIYLRHNHCRQKLVNPLVKLESHLAVKWFYPFCVFSLMYWTAHMHYI